LLKGVLHPADAELAIQAGVDGIIVSNHGGRNLDTVIPPIEALPDITQQVAGRIPLLVDRGRSARHRCVEGSSPRRERGPDWATIPVRFGRRGRALPVAADPGVTAGVCAGGRNFATRP
jgi:hypothetical protein